MKKILLLSSIITAFVACGKAEIDNNVENNSVAFVKGEQVTFTVTANLTKATSYLNGDELKFKWEDRDTIKVSVGGASSTFTVSKLIDEGASAEFTGTMPADGTAFDVQYPVAGVSESDLETQQWTASGENPIDYLHGKMLFTKTGCAKDVSFTLEPQYSAVCLNIYSSLGGDETEIIAIDTIEVAMQGGKTYTLDCGEDGAYVSSEDTEPTPFFLVVVPGTYKMTVTVSNGGTGKSTQFSTSSAQTFEKGKFTNMTPAKDVDWVWNSCLAAGTKIAMADGSVKNIEDIVEGDEVKTFDHEAGILSSSKICLVVNDDNKSLPLTLNFSSGKSLTIVGTHDLLEESSRKYVRINRSNVKDYLGRNYYNAESASWEKLESYEIGTELELSYYIVSAYHLNFIANGMLTLEDDIDFHLNMYELDANLKADAGLLAADVATYGLFDVTRELPEYTQFHEVLDQLGAKYVNVLLGKGLVPPDYIETMKAYWTGQ